MKENCIGFIGAGYMGYGMAHNLVKNNYNLSVICNKNRNPIDKLVAQGAKELKNYKDLCDFSNIIIMCVTNTPIAIEIINKLKPYLEINTMIIDITTHHSNGSIEINNLLASNKIKYVEAPVMGGPVQAEQGILGAIVGSKIEDYEEAKNILLNFCKEAIYFGEVGKGAKAKLLSNFLSLGTTTFVIETLKAANHLDIDLQKLYDVAKLGSGNSGALNRITDKAINGDYTGYVFSVKNAVKDLTYINELMSDLPNADKLSHLTKSIYEEAVKNGKGDLLMSELIKE
ncbi:NAD(P)-dependent oxidoreductase [Alphaproteobacteria bacterium]|nr:NAD(P)-dependent oxidoreductase [Alphaproteobacteria bacterium]